MEIIREWRIIHNFPNYSVSSQGLVKNNKTNLILKRIINSNGYLHVGLYNDQKKKINKKIHRLVAEAFIQNINNYNIIDHIDRNKFNNMVNNLRWCTQSENMRNRNIQINNKSGIKGISYNIKGYWICQYNDEINKQINKYFSIKIHGEEEAKNMAIQYRMEKAIQLNYLN